MDDGFTGGEGRRPADSGLSAEPPPVSGSDADMMQAPDRPAAVTEHEFGSTDAGLGSNFFGSELAPIDIPAADSSGFDAYPAPDLSAAAEHAPGSMDTGLSDSSFFDSKPMQTGPQKTTDALDSVLEPAREAPVEELTETAFSDDMPSEALFFDVEPVETEAEPGASKNLEGGEEPSSFTLDVPAPGPGVTTGSEAASFGGTLPETDDFTTDTLAELYIAQGFYEKAIEIYERMLADRPNSKLLKDKLANVRAMGSASSTDEGQGTPAFFEVPDSPPAPSPQPVAADRAGQWRAPGVEVEAREYVPPPADDLASTAFDSGFAPVEYVLPEAPGTVPPPSVGQTLPAQDEEPLPVSPKTAPLGKERAIVKLDAWLKNIMKEK